MSSNYSKNYFTSLSMKGAEQFQLYLNLLRQHVELKDLAILDIGCAEGAFFEPLVGHNRCYGCDISEHAIRKCREHHPQQKNNFMIWDCNRQHLPVNAAFNVMTAFDVIEHLDNFFYLKEAVSQNLTEGGHLMITTPNANALGRLKSKLDYTGERDPTHTILFTPYTLDFWLRRQGLVKVALLTPYSFHFRDTLFTRRLLWGGQIIALYRKVKKNEDQIT
jgi:2-polyprenyl-3-methyl-5-hydroxy-6-metoxy-1,4-benzoquinol methylase